MKKQKLCTALFSSLVLFLFNAKQSLAGFDPSSDHRASRSSGSTRGGWDKGTGIAEDATGLEDDVRISDVLANVLFIGSMLLGSLGVLGFLIAGIIYVTAAGNEERMEMAKRAMMYSIIGVAVGALGFAALTLMENVFQGGNDF